VSLCGNWKCARLHTHYRHLVGEEVSHSSGLIRKAIAHCAKVEAVTSCHMPELMISDIEVHIDWICLMTCNCVSNHSKPRGRLPRGETVDLAL